jgi:predicted HTH transcriptional regulator
MLTPLIHSLVALPEETEWVEFKQDNWNLEEIGQNISAISNATALYRRPMGYIVWGITDEEHAITGTTFLPRSTKKGNEELENWLARLLEPRIDFRIHEGLADGRPIVVIEVPPATHMPVRFSGREYVRVGSYTKPLSAHPEKERSLWALFNEVSFEAGIAAGNVSSDDVLELIDYPEYFRLIQQTLPDNRATILAKLTAEKIIGQRMGNGYDITNVGAILFARNLKTFDRLARKALRVIIYKGDNRVETIREQPGNKGYALGFEGALGYINDQLPQNEQIKQALRSEVRRYPEIAIRELVANALIHQDFNVTGTGPMVEIFVNRMEISNPGAPLIDPLRFIDEPPRSRNETLAALMRRMRVCEERGSGIDKVICAVEAFQLPAPDFRVAGASTVAVLYGPRGFADMDRGERIRACYQHACLQYVSGKRMTNASLRERLGIEESNYPLASRVIRDTIAAELAKPYGEGSSPRTASYVPYWA